MPHLNGTGPDSKGSKSGRMLGECHKTEPEKKEAGELGAGQGKRRNSGGGTGSGKRLKHDSKK